ncbi:hypothetical protein JCM14076_28330 [Methylosoma difficile]
MSCGEDKPVVTVRMAKSESAVSAFTEKLTPKQNTKKNLITPPDSDNATP